MNTIFKTLLVIGLLAIAATPVAEAAVSKKPITLQWDKSPDPSVIGYKVYYSYPGIAFRVLQIGNVNVAELDRLTKGKMYTIYVVSFNSSGVESPPSNSVSYVAR